MFSDGCSLPYKNSFFKSLLTGGVILCIILPYIACDVIMTRGYKKEDNKKYCSHCGKEVNDNAVICPYCGCETSGRKTGEKDGSSIGFAILSFLFPVSRAHFISGMERFTSFTCEERRQRCFDRCLRKRGNFYFIYRHCSGHDFCNCLKIKNSYYSKRYPVGFPERDTFLLIRFCATVIAQQSTCRGYPIRLTAVNAKQSFAFYVLY